MTVPYYYSRLGPFREAFRAGAPILVYHHIAPPRRGAQVKSLYVSPAVFARQLAELQSAGFSTPKFGTIAGTSTSCEHEKPVAVSMDNLLESGGESTRAMATTLTRPPAVTLARQPANAGRSVYLSFDDGFRDVFETALPLLRQSRRHSILYLVSKLLGKTNEWQLMAGDVPEPLMDVSQVREWLATGQDIGSHTQTHPRLTQLSLAAAGEEITASKKSLEDRFGIPVEHFCYPYGDWNKAIRDLVIEAGYKTACTTDRGINNGQTSPFELKRLTARYEGRTVKTIWKRLRVRLGLIEEDRHGPV